LVAKKSWTDADISAIAPQTVSRTCLIRHRLIRYFFVGPGRIPIFCIHFCSS